MARIVRLLVTTLSLLALALPASAGDKVKRLNDLECDEDQIPKIRAGIWECADDETGEDAGGAVIVLLDSDDPPKQVGLQVVDIASSTFRAGIFATILLEFVDDTGAVHNGIGHVEEGGFSHYPSLLFTEPGCNTTPHIPLEPENTLFQPHPLFVATNSEGNPALFRSAGSSLVINSRSSQRQGPHCAEVSGSSLALPVQMVDPDLHSTFPPPYRLEVRK